MRPPANKAMLISKTQLTLILLLFFLFITPSCAGSTSTSTLAPVVATTATENLLNTPELSSTISSTSTPGLNATSVPPGTFVLLIYPPLAMNYATITWKDESQYADVSSQPVYTILNYLQSLSLASCQIGVQGPTGDFPPTPETVQLDSVQYEVIIFTDSPIGSTTGYYIENQSLPRFDYETGSPVLVVQASSDEWNECKTAAEEVLATLHVP